MGHLCPVGRRVTVTQWEYGSERRTGRFPALTSGPPESRDGGRGTERLCPQSAWPAPQDVLASNHLARALITDFETLANRERNFARFVLLDPSARELYANWDEVAEIVVALLRLASGRRPDDTRLNELICEACVKVPEFNAWWSSHRLDQCAYGAQRFQHPVVGELTLHHETLAFPADPDHTICLYTAEAGSASAQTLAFLASWSAPDGSTGTGVPGRPGSDTAHCA
ncbi:MmyB family transcriptional regulator [Streptomyces mirabilis]|uniref:MmyB family transcriptional regulator n=1 Tax=Streptomyces mirabilis TaxID=68239 RepID=UPI00364FBC4B